MSHSSSLSNIHNIEMYAGKVFTIIHIVNERTSFVCVTCYRIHLVKKSLDWIGWMWNSWTQNSAFVAMKISKPGSVPPNTQTSVALRILKREMPKCGERKRKWGREQHKWEPTKSMMYEKAFYFSAIRFVFGILMKFSVVWKCFMPHENCIALIH